MNKAEQKTGRMSSDLEQNIGYLETFFHGNFDIKFRNFKLACGTKASAVFLDGMTDRIEIDEYIVMALQREGQKDDVNSILEQILNSAEAEIQSDMEELCHGVLNGDTVLLVDGQDQGLLLGTRKWGTRGILEPPTSAVLKGPREGFNEDLKTNMTLIRRKLRSKELVFQSFEVGKYSNTAVCLCYLDDIVDKKIVKQVTDKLQKIEIDGILDSSYIAKFLEIRTHSSFKQVGTAEKPDIVAAKLLEGRIALIVDGSPIVLTLPFLLLEGLQSPEDYYERRFRSTFARIIRFLGIIMSVLVPALYVSAQVYNLGMIPLRFTVTILNSIKGIPLSPALEMFFVVLIFEILNEASVRMPKYVGMALSIVGALVLGETAVSAGIVSTPALMIMAISAISLYTVPELQNALSILRLAFLLLAGVMGVYGVLLGVIFTLNYLLSLESYGPPYFAPFAPLVPQDMKDSVVKQELADMTTRPKSFRNRNSIRLKAEKDGKSH